MSEKRRLEKIISDCLNKLRIYTPGSLTYRTIHEKYGWACVKLYTIETLEQSIPQPILTNKYKYY